MGSRAAASDLSTTITFLLSNRPGNGVHYLRFLGGCFFATSAKVAQEPARLRWSGHCNTSNALESLSSACNTLLITLPFCTALCLGNRVLPVDDCSALFGKAWFPFPVGCFAVINQPPQPTCGMMWIAQPPATLPIHSTNGQTSDGTKPRRGDAVAA